MRSVIRQSARLVRPSGTVRQSSSTRLAPVQNKRNFHGSVQSLSEARGPSGHNEHHTSFEQRQEEQEKPDDGSAASEKDLEHDDVQPPTDARKTLRKTLRQRRTVPDIPKPPPIPDWFLKYNVSLHADDIMPDRFANSAQVVRCVDNATGHTLFVIPYCGAYAAERHQAPGSDPEVAGSSSSVPHERGTQSPAALETKNQRSNLSSHMLQDVGQQGTLKNKSNSDSDPLRWNLLEIESSIRAAFTLQDSTHRSYAASHVDVSLLCPDSRAHARVDQFVEDVSTLTGADLIRLDANDFADLTADYVGHGSDAPNRFSTLGYDVFDGFTAKASSQFTRPAEVEDQEDDEVDEDEESQLDSSKGIGINLGSVSNLRELRQALHDRRHELASALGRVSLQGIAVGEISSPDSGAARASSQSVFRPTTQSSGYDWDEARLSALLDSLLEASNLKRSQEPQNNDHEPRLRAIHPQAQAYTGARDFGDLSPQSLDSQNSWRRSRGNTGYWFPEVAGLLKTYLERQGTAEARMVEPASMYKLLIERHGSESTEPFQQPRRTIVHVRDLSDICGTPIGSSIIQRLLRVIQKRRKTGEHIIFVGTTAHEVSGSVRNGQQEPDGLALRHLVLPPFFQMETRELDNQRPVPLPSKSTNYRVLEINLRHIQNMLSRTRPTDKVDLFSESSQAQLTLPETRILSEKVFPLDFVQRIVLTAIGLSEVHTVSETITALHIALSILITSNADDAVQVWSDHRRAVAHVVDETSKTDRSQITAEQMLMRSIDIDQLKKDSNTHESRLLSGVIDPENIKTGFKEVHASQDTIGTLKSLTSLSLLRPDAFKYGILANDRLTGLMLYGPPGTGKTLLAKAVAKESRATMLEISGAQIYEKYVGEGEKMVRAVFSLAKKISPCIVFIDEADSIFGSRGGAGDRRNTHREIINQFLREWDGMDAHNVFVMVASNRPFDLDDAVLRRLPRRLLVDLPTVKDREAILKIHLKDEHLDASVSLPALAEQTPLYSGSDLKNLSVAAALACVREENELAERSKDDADFKLPDKRSLSSHHFEQAMREISASISEDMNSLTAIRKFDEQYGDRRGRQKKTEYGFGLGNQEGLDESAARVRQLPPSP